MNILKSWLKDFIEFDLSDDKLSDLLTFSGTLVEEIYKGVDEKVIVGQIKKISPHPNADRLQVAIVDNGQEELQIVCGATNIAEGQKVPLAQIGTKFGDFEIKQAQIRSVDSFGMLCSQKELGIGEDHEGIYILPEDWEVGKSLADYLDTDTIFELEITPNRGDCLSHLGIARELSAILRKPLLFKNEEYTINLKTDELSVDILDSEKCYSYFGAKIRGVKVGPSPEWLSKRLLSIGVNPINNVVDVTNYVMMALGQPMHAFDASAVIDNKIVVRSANQGESILTLDNQNVQLLPEMLVIADSEKPLAIAGVIGGLDSGVVEQTSDIILESAVFDRKNIRKTSKDLKITTEASYRFERAVDQQTTEVALGFAIKMIIKIAGGELVGKFGQHAFEIQNDYVKIEYQKINDLLGHNFSEEEVNTYLQSLGFELKDVMAQAPSYRFDISIWQDLAEEVARLFDINNLPKTEVPKSKLQTRADYFYKEAIKDLLVEEGFCEVSNYPFISEKDVSQVHLDSNDLLEVTNPIQEENKYMRNSLKPGLLRNIAKNPTFDNILIFEIANVFDKENEYSVLALAVSGKSAKESLATTLDKIEKISSIKIELETVGEQERAIYKIKKPNTFYAQIHTADLIAALRKSDFNPTLKITDHQIKYRKVSKFPPIARDLAFILSKDVDNQEFVQTIYAQSDSIILVELFDEFVSDKLGENKKSLAFHIWLQDVNKTLETKDSDEIIKKITKSLDEKFSAQLRS